MPQGLPQNMVVERVVGTFLLEPQRVVILYLEQAAVVREAEQTIPRQFTQVQQAAV